MVVVVIHQVRPAAAALSSPVVVEESFPLVVLVHASSALTEAVEVAAHHAIHPAGHLILVTVARATPHELHYNSYASASPEPCK